MAQNGPHDAADPAEVARLIRELLAAVERGELEAREPVARHLVARLQVTVHALDVLVSDEAAERFSALRPTDTRSH